MKPRLRIGQPCGDYLSVTINGHKARVKTWADVERIVTQFIDNELLQSKPRTSA